MKKTKLFAIAIALLAPLFLAVGSGRTASAVSLSCDTTTISADSLLNETPLFDRLYLDAVCRQLADDSTSFALLERCREMRPDAAEVYFALTTDYGKQGNDSLVIECLRRAAELQPDNDYYQETGADVYTHQNQFDLAIETFERLYEHHKDRSDVLEMLVRLYGAKRDYAKMLATVDRMEQADGKSDELSFLRMEIYEQQGDKKNAYKTLKSLTESHPNEPSYKVMLGNWLMQHERQSEAYKLFLSALDDDKQNEFALNSLYDYYRNAGDNAAARKLRDDLLFSTQTAVKTKIMMLQQAIRENEQEASGDSTQVLALFDKTMLSAPRNSELSNLKAMYMKLKNMPTDSIDAAYRHTLSFEPDNMSARLNLVQNAFERGDWDAVVNLCDKGIQYVPNELSFYYFLGLAYTQKDDDSKAFDAFSHGVSAFDPSKADDTERSIASDMYGQIADIQYGNNRVDEAFAAYDKALEMNANNYTVLNNYAYYLSQQGKNLERAAEMSLKTLKEEPTNATYLDTYAWILYLQKRYDEAKAYMELVLENEKQPDATIFEHAGDISLMAGDKAKAAEYWQKAIEWGGDKARLERKINSRKANIRK